MKRFFAILLVLLLGCGTALFGLDLSAGAMIDYTRVNEHVGGSFGGSSGYDNINIPALNLGAFFDATYAQVSIGYFGSLTGKEDISSGGTTTSADYNYYTKYISAGLLGKYPFDLGMVKLFPLLGIEYDLNLSLTDQNGNDVKSTLTDQEKKDMNQFWVKVGAGADFDLTKNIYFRPEILFGYKLPSQTDKDTVDSLQAAGATGVSVVWTRWDFGLMAGYRF